MPEGEEKAPCAHALSVRDAWAALAGPWAERVTVNWCTRCQRFRRAECQIVQAQFVENGKRIAAKRRKK